MPIFQTENQREVRVLEHLQKQIERREKVHRFLIVGLAGMLTMSLAIHAACHFRRK